MKNILITGGGGFIGRHLIKRLQADGHQVSVLSRNPEGVKGMKAFYWNPKKQEIDRNCLSGINTIIHLAGEGIADKRWTESRKQEIIDSRTLSIGLLYQVLQETRMSVDSVISASAVGYYGDRGEELLTEGSTKGTGFLADCCQQWEEAVDYGMKLGFRVVKFRIGLPLSEEGGALMEFKKIVRSYMGSDLGNGRQWYPWIHIDDLVEMFVRAVDDSAYQGTYNACAPYPVRNHEFTKEVAKALHRPLWPLKVNKALLNIVLGEKSNLILMSSNTSSRKVEDQGYEFRYKTIQDALSNIFSFYAK